jgi:hypothetical protein
VAMRIRRNPNCWLVGGHLWEPAVFTRLTDF